MEGTGCRKRIPLPALAHELIFFPAWGQEEAGDKAQEGGAGSFILS